MVFAITGSVFQQFALFQTLKNPCQGGGVGYHSEQGCLNVLWFPQILKLK